MELSKRFAYGIIGAIIAFSFVALFIGQSMAVESNMFYRNEIPKEVINATEHQNKECALTLTNLLDQSNGKDPVEFFNSRGQAVVEIFDYIDYFETTELDRSGIYVTIELLMASEDQRLAQINVIKVDLEKREVVSCDERTEKF